MFWTRACFEYSKISIKKSRITYTMFSYGIPIASIFNIFYYHHLCDNMQSPWTLLVSFSYWHRNDMSCYPLNMVPSRKHCSGHFNVCYYGNFMSFVKYQYCTSINTQFVTLYSFKIPEMLYMFSNFGFMADGFTGIAFFPWRKSITWQKVVTPIKLPHVSRKQVHKIKANMFTEYKFRQLKKEHALLFYPVPLDAYFMPIN